MRRLIRADIHALFKDKTYLVVCGFSFILGIFLPLMGYINKLRFSEIKTFEDGFFIYVSVFSFLVPGFIAFFVGKSFDWGTIKNKICVGHKRLGIYLSFLITCVIGTMVLILSYYVPYTILGLFLLEAMDIPLKGFILISISAIFVLISITSISLSLTVNLSSRVLSIAISIVVVVALLMIGSIAVQMLMEPEMITNSMIMIDGEFVFSDPYPNPRYVKESERWIWEGIRDAVLGGQIHQITALECNWVRVTLYSLLTSIVFSFVGYIIFNRKDLK